MKNGIYNVFLDSTEIRCKPNSVLTSRLLNYILSNGHNFVEKISDADFIVLNTCGADDFREKTSIDRIRIYKKLMKSGSKIVFVGCLTKINVDALVDYLADIIVIQDNNKLDDFFYISRKYEDIRIDYIDDRIYDKLKIPLHDGAFGKIFKRVEGLYRREWQKKRVDIEICEGCPFNCSYCAMTRSRGKTVVSRDSRDIIEDIGKLVSGNKIISLVADDCGSYGIDIKADLCDLMIKISDKFPQNPLDIYYMNPHWIERFGDRYIDMIKKVSLSAITIPVQSGSNKIIKKMNRKYDIHKIIDVIKKIRKISPKTVVVTHLMVGFPGETTMDFIKTILIIRHFDVCNPIIYSERPGTVSSTMPDKKSGFTKFIRHKVLMMFCVIAFGCKFIYKPIINKLSLRNISFTTKTNLAE